MYTFQEMVAEVDDWLKAESLENIKQFYTIDKKDLISYHHSLGRSIRNHFGLWSTKWEPVLVDDIDMAEDHPDRISMDVITAVWEKGQ